MKYTTALYQNDLNKNAIYQGVKRQKTLPILARFLLRFEYLLQCRLCLGQQFGRKLPPCAVNHGWKPTRLHRGFRQVPGLFFSNGLRLLDPN